MDASKVRSGRARRVGAAAALVLLLATMAGLGAGGASAATGDQVVVASGFDGKLYTSTNDGVTWGSAVSPLSGTQYMYSVAKGYDSFVATYSGSPSCGKVATSPDGATWTVQTTNQSWCFDTIRYRNGVFVATGYGFIGTSTDGVTWTLRESIGGWGYGLAYGGGVWVVATSSGGGYRSTDGGLTWTGTTVGIMPTAVDYAGDRFIAVGPSGTLRWSTDGTTWTAATSAALGDLYFAAKTAANLYVVGGLAGIWTSPDLTTWTSRTTSSARAIAQGSTSGYIAGGAAGVLTSTDAVTWTNRMAPTSADLTAIAAGVAAPPPTTTTTSTSTTTSATLPPTTTTTDPMDGPCRWEWGGMQEFHPEPCPGSDSIELTGASAPAERPIGGADLLAVGLLLVVGRAVLRAADRRRS